MGNEGMEIAMGGIEEFNAAFSGATGNQTGAEEESNVDVGSRSEAQEGAKGGENTDESSDTSNQENPGNEERSDSDNDSEETKNETFTLKVNHAEMNVDREQVVALAQKGADYDRVKGKLQEATAFQQANQDTVDTIAEIADRTGMTVPELLDRFRLNMLTNSGLSEDVAAERLARQKAESRLQKMEQDTKAKQSQEALNAQRAEREIKEFQQLFPGVTLSKEEIQSMAADIQSGMPLSMAYQRKQNAALQKQNQELARQIEAMQQTRKNRAQSPGSQNDVGSPKQNSEFDEFMSSFNK